MEEMKSNISEGLLKLDNSRRGDFERCPRKYYWVQRRGIVSDYGSTALRYGSVWHDAMEAFYTVIMEKGWTARADAMQAAIMAATESWERNTNKYALWWDDYRTLENLGLSFMKYVDHFIADEMMMEILHPEMPFRIKMKLTEEELKVFPMDDFWFTGRIDCLISLNDQPWQLEHKTTGQPLHKQKERLNRTPQIIGYTYAGKVAYRGIMPFGTLVSLHHLSSRKSTKKEYRDAGITVYGKAKIDFDRPPQSFTETDIANWRESFLYTVFKLRECIKQDFWPMQFDSCYTYGRCPYCNLCEQDRHVDNVILEGYHEEELWDPTKDINPDFIYE